MAAAEGTRATWRVMIDQTGSRSARDCALRGLTSLGHMYHAFPWKELRRKCAAFT